MPAPVTRPACGCSSCPVQPGRTRGQTPRSATATAPTVKRQNTSLISTTTRNICCIFGRRRSIRRWLIQSSTSWQADEPRGSETEGIAHLGKVSGSSWRAHLAWSSLRDFVTSDDPVSQLRSWHTDNTQDRSRPKDSASSHLPKHFLASAPASCRYCCCKRPSSHKHTELSAKAETKTASLHCSQVMRVDPSIVAGSRRRYTHFCDYLVLTYLPI